MTISGTGATDVTLRRPVPREGGFSLVELLVAVFIMALASTAIILAAPKRPDPAAAAVTRLAGLVTELVDGAVLTGETRSLLVGPSSIRMQTWRDGDWRDLPVRPVRLGSDVRAETVNRSMLSRDSDQKIRIVADRTGIVLAQDIKLIGPHETWRVSIAADGSTTTEHSDG